MKKKLIQELVKNGYKRQDLLACNKDELALLLQEERSMVANMWTPAARAAARIAREIATKHGYKATKTLHVKFDGKHYVNQVFTKGQHEFEVSTGINGKTGWIHSHDANGSHAGASGKVIGSLNRLLARIHGKK